MSNEHEALKPCPFCGGTARLWPVIMPFDAGCDTITIQCASCDAIGATVLVDQDVHDQSDLPSLEAEAITAWNTRATPSPAPSDTLEPVSQDARTQAQVAEVLLKREAQRLTDTLERREAIIRAIINAYHTTRLDSDYVPHILSKRPVKDAFAALSLPAREVSEADEYVIRKGGYYYRPNAQGYTPSIHEAGRYSLADAISLTHPNGPDGPRDELSYMPAPAREVSGERAIEAAYRRGHADGCLGAWSSEEDDNWQRYRSTLALATTPAPREMEADLVEAVKALRHTLSELWEDRHSHQLRPDFERDFATEFATLAKLDRSV